MDKKGTTIPRRVEDLDLEGVVTLLVRCGHGDFVDFVRDKEVDGRNLLEVTEGIVKLWRPKANASKFIKFIKNIKENPQKYLESMKDDAIELDNKPCKEVYQIVNVKRKTENFASSTVSSVEEILKKIVPAKSFLYRNQLAKTEKPVASYVPMDAAAPKKPRRLFRLSSYEYPHFDLRQKRSSETENYNDRGYYSIKTNSRFYIHKPFRKPESLRTKYKSLSAAEELDKLPEDHFYEDLNYPDVENEESDLREANSSAIAKPYRVKIQELFQFFKIPYFKKSEDTIGEKRLEVNSKPEAEDKDGHIYDISDTISNMYDSVHVNNSEDTAGDSSKYTKLPVEDYLDPVELSKDYCDVSFRPRDESLLSYIVSIFGSRFGFGRETNDDATSSELSSDKDPCTLDERSDSRPDRKGANMADRPLPVPVENEPYYMSIDRTEAENLLKGHPDGTFVLRPSSQPNHAYTLTVSCSNAVHNVGVRRRPDGRLALGFARKGERSFASVTSLLRHHKKRRLLLVAGGNVCGATTLNETPQYYQTPSNLPLSM